MMKGVMSVIFKAPPLTRARAYHSVGAPLNGAVAVEAYDIRVTQTRKHAALVLKLRRLHTNKQAQPRHQNADIQVSGIKQHGTKIRQYMCNSHFQRKATMHVFDQ